MSKKQSKKSRKNEMPDDVSNLKGWKKSRRAADPGSVKLHSRRITINIDSDIIAIFKVEALEGGAPYQVAINQALRSYLQHREAMFQERSTKAVLTALDDPAVRRKIRVIAAAKKPKD